MADIDDKGPMRGPRSTEDAMKSAAAVAPGRKQDEGDRHPSPATPTDDATKPIMTDQEDA